jgi:hypothetical protein
MKGKLSTLKDRGCHVMYYDLHARLLFVSKLEKPLREMRKHLVSLRLHTERLLEVGI